MTRSLFLTAAAILLASCSPGAADISVSDGWARATVAGQSSGAGYLTIRNAGDGDDRLLSASTPAAGETSLHTSANEGGVARMRPLTDGLAIAAGETVKLQPGGHHLMLTGLRQPLASGQPVELSLRFERSGERKLPVRIAQGASGGTEGMNH